LSVSLVAALCERAMHAEKPPRLLAERDRPAASPLSPCSFPRASFHHTVRPLWAVWSGSPRRRTQRAASAISASTARGCLLLLCKIGGGQRPVTHRTHPASNAQAMPVTAAGQLPYAAKPERPVSGRVTTFW
jgi:hypothetical protein